VTILLPDTCKAGAAPLLGVVGGADVGARMLNEIVLDWPVAPRESTARANAVWLPAGMLPHVKPYGAVVSVASRALSPQNSTRAIESPASGSDALASRVTLPGATGLFGVGVSVTVGGRLVGDVFGVVLVLADGDTLVGGALVATVPVQATLLRVNEVGLMLLPDHRPLNPTEVEAFVARLPL
jgi:hypothetical protein